MKTAEGGGCEKHSPERATLSWQGTGAGINSSRMQVLITCVHFMRLVSFMAGWYARGEGVFREGEVCGLRWVNENIVTLVARGW